MPDLTPFLPLLQSLGPWGWVIAGVYLFLRYRNGQPILPVIPTPTPTIPPPDQVPPVLPAPFVSQIVEELRKLFPHLFGQSPPK